MNGPQSRKKSVANLDVQLKQISIFNWIQFLCCPVAALGGETNNKLVRVEVNKEGRRGLNKACQEKSSVWKTYLSALAGGCVDLGLWDGLIGRVWASCYTRDETFSHLTGKLMPRYPPASEGFEEFVLESCFFNIFVQKLDKFQMTRLGIRTEASLVNDIRSLPAAWASCVTTSEFSRLRKAKRPKRCHKRVISLIRRFYLGLWSDDNQGMDVGRRWSRKSCSTRKKVATLVHQRSRKVKVVSSISKMKLDQGGFWEDSTDAALPRTDKWRQNEGHA